MSLLSNLPFLRHFRPTTPADVSIGVRPAHDSELPQAIRLIIRPPRTDAGEAQVDDFVELARSSSARAGGVWIGQRRGRIVTAILPVVSPGETVLLFAPAPPREPIITDLTRMAIEGACHTAAHSGVALAQALLEPHDAPQHALFQACGFGRLSELLYMQTRAPRHAPDPELPPGLHWVRYAPTTHNLFGQTILAAYADSLDCPALNGMRQIEHILAGHKATGDFDPNLWLLLMQHNTPLGVMLLNPIPRNDAVEIVYLGLTPQSRGRGLGDLLMRQALSLTATTPCSRLTLAVDAANTPALKLYWRHGMQSIARKVAFLRDLRPLPDSPHHAQGPA